MHGQANEYVTIQNKEIVQAYIQRNKFLKKKLFYSRTVVQNTNTLENKQMQIHRNEDISHRSINNMITTQTNKQTNKQINK